MTMFKSFLLTIFFCAYTNCLTCKNENNETVDWYYLYKLPVEHNSNSHIKNGVAYLYMTSNDYETGWKLSNKSVDDINSIPGLTLSPFYKGATFMHIFYNDQPPSGSKNSKLGHTKGVLMSNESTGFWLIHSVPKYPPIDKYGYPATGQPFGQSFLCISLNLENVNNVGKQMQFNEPHMYESHIDDILKKKLDNVYAVIQHEKVSSAPWYRLTALNSSNGEQFMSFAKSKHFGKEIYGDWVAPILKSDLLVESWLNGDGRIPSLCNNIFQVNNVESVNPANTSIFKSSKDHSKWAVSNSKNIKKYWICVGDINREEHQKLRGGGTVCISKQKLWNQYKRIITTIELCKP